jgi:hypothetical protein
MLSRLAIPFCCFFFREFFINFCHLFLQDRMSSFFLPRLHLPSCGPSPPLMASPGRPLLAASATSSLFLRLLTQPCRWWKRHRSSFPHPFAPIRGLWCSSPEVPDPWVPPCSTRTLGPPRSLRVSLVVRQPAEHSESLLSLF